MDLHHRRAVSALRLASCFVDDPFLALMATQVPHVWVDDPPM